MDTNQLLTLQAAQNQASAGVQARIASAATQPNGAHNAKLGKDFEAMCLSNLLSPMFEGLETDGPFGGGQAESAMRSFYVDAIAKNMAQRGGIGISDMMQKQLLKLQGAA
ncbi:MAG: rod-binding protein [Asticcacaulis sp.]|nr:rod-binding protein [Asticcacaulis sp.]